MTYTLQKSFRLEDGRLVTLKSGRPIESCQVAEGLSQEGFAATISVNYWISILSPNALCSFATEPGIRAIIEAEELLERKGVEVVVPSYRIMALAADYSKDNEALRGLFPGLPIFDPPEALRKTFQVTTRREAKLALRKLRS